MKLLLLRLLPLSSVDITPMGSESRQTAVGGSAWTRYINVGNIRVDKTYTMSSDKARSHHLLAAARSWFTNTHTFEMLKHFFPFSQNLHSILYCVSCICSWPVPIQHSFWLFSWANVVLIFLSSSLFISVPAELEREKKQESVSVFVCSLKQRQIV